MSQGLRLLPKNIKRIEIVLSTKESVSFKTGCLRCQLLPVNFRFAEHLLWSAIFLDVTTKGKSTTLNVATCQSKERRH